MIQATKELRPEQERASRIVNAADIKIETVLHDPKRRELYRVISSLSRDARSELIALMLLGRGTDDFAAGLAIAQSQDDDVQVSYIGGKTALLSRYLEEGLKKAKPT